MIKFRHNLTAYEKKNTDKMAYSDETREFCFEKGSPEWYRLEKLKSDVAEYEKLYPTEESALEKARSICQRAMEIEEELKKIDYELEVLGELPYPRVRAEFRGNECSLDEAHISKDTREALKLRGFDTIEEVILEAPAHKELRCNRKYIYKDLNRVCEELGYPCRFEV